jgi:hypothetical protein
MPAEEVKAFALRWRMVQQTEVAELRATPGGRKLEMLASLMASARALGWATTDPAEVEEVRSRWIRLRTKKRG